jgi:cobyrinic acid a,c-diamide synthase
MNTVTPRVYIAATRQNEGKTTTSLGLLAALQKFYPICPNRRRQN